MEQQGSGGLSLMGDGSVLLEVSGEFTVPNVRSKEELQEALLAKKYVLDLRRTEIRMSDSVRRDVYKALGIAEEEAVDVVKKIFLNGFITSAPLGTNELVRCFLRRGTREQHFSLLRELAKRRRAELERDVTRKGIARQQCSESGKVAQKHLDRQMQSASTIPSSHQIHSQEGADMSEGTTADREGEDKSEANTSGPKKGAAAAGRSGGKGSNCLPQPYEELTTFRSATTASEMETFR